jgi:hypothetical protein
MGDKPAKWTRNLQDGGRNSVSKPAVFSSHIHSRAFSASARPINAYDFGARVAQNPSFVRIEALGTAWSANDLNGDGVISVTDVQIEIDAALNLGCSAGQLNAATLAPAAAVRTNFVKLGTPGAGIHH